MSVSVPPQIDRSDIQGNVLRAYGNTYPCTAYVFVALGEVAGGRAWLDEVADLVSSDEEWRHGSRAPTATSRSRAPGCAHSGCRRR